MEDLSKLTKEELIARVKDQKAAQEAALSLKVSTKGGASLYGIRRFPVTFYADEWETILGQADKIKKFLKDNERSLSRKGDRKD